MNSVPEIEDPGKTIEYFYASAVREQSRRRRIIYHCGIAIGDNPTGSQLKYCHLNLFNEFNIGYICQNKVLSPNYCCNYYFYCSNGLSKISIKVLFKLGAKIMSAAEVKPSFSCFVLNNYYLVL